MSCSSLFFSFSFFAFPLVSSACHVSPCIPPRISPVRNFFDLRLATNDRPDTNKRTDGGRVSDMQTRRAGERAHPAKHRGRLHKVHAPLVRTQSCAARPSQHTTPHHTRPHHIARDTTPRTAGFAPQRQGQRLSREAAACSPGLRRHHPTPAAAVLCRGHCFSTGTRALFRPGGSWLWLQAHGLVVDPQSAVWPPSTFTNDACPCPRLCTSTVCACMHSSPVPALVSGDRFS